MKQVRALTHFSFVSLIAAWPFMATGAPSISGVEGELVQGSQVIILGSNFGVKSPAKPYLWVPFEGSADPSPLGLTTSWTVNNDMVYTPDEGAGGSGGLKAANNGGTWAASVTATGFNWNDPGQKMYLYRKSKRNFDIWNNPPGITLDGSPEINYKTWRLWTDGHTIPDALVGISNGAISITPSLESSSGLWFSGDNKAAAGRVGEWHTNEIVIRSNTNSLGRGDGFFQYLTNGTVYAEVPYQGWEGTRYFKMWDADNPPSMVINYVVHEVKANATFPSDWRAWADDVYLDTTWARVMIGDAPIFADAKHREIQIPSAWSSSSVTVTTHTGTFPADATPYLFVIDADGNASQGYALGAIRPRPPEAIRAE